MHCCCLKTTGKCHIQPPRYSFKRYLITKTNTDHFIYTGLRNRVVSELRKAKTNYFSKLIEEANGSSSKLWKHINGLTNSSRQKHPKINCLKVDNNLIHSNESIANVFNSFFIESVQELASNFKFIKSSSEELDHVHSDSFYIKGVSHDKVKKSYCKHE